MSASLPDASDLPFPTLALRTDNVHKNSVLVGGSAAFSSLERSLGVLGQDTEDTASSASLGAASEEVYLSWLLHSEEPRDGVM